MTRLEKLKDLEMQLCTMMVDASPREMAPLAKQYRETLREIEELESGDDSDDAIASILNRSGQPDTD